MALSCYRCGASLSELSLPLRRLDECPACGVELHVCRMCVNYAPDRPKGCAEDDAIEVRDKSRANFCDYFKPSEWAYRPGANEAESAAKAQLRALFGEPGDAAANPTEPPDDAGDAAAGDARADGAAQPDGAGQPDGTAHPNDAAQPDGAAQPDDTAQPDDAQAAGSERRAAGSATKSPEERALEQARSLFKK